MVTEGGEDGHDHHSEKAAGKPHVVEVHAVLDLVGVGREGGQDETDDHAGKNPQGQAGVDTAKTHVAHQRRQRRGQQGHRRMLGKGLPLVLGVEPGAQDDGPDVEEVLPEEGEARHQPHLHHGKAVEGVFGQLDEADGQDHHKARVHQRRTHAADGHVIRNQQVLHGDDMVEADGDLHRIVQQDAQQDHDAGHSYGAGKNFLVAIVHTVSPLSRFSHCPL